MPQLIITSEFTQNREQRFLIQKSVITVGMEPYYDVYVPKPGGSGLLFTLLLNKGDYEILPAQTKLKINGQTLYRSKILRPCDRIEWHDGAVVFLLSAADASVQSSGPLRSLQVLQNLTSALQNPGSMTWALHQILDELIEISGAETGYLLSEIGGGSNWEMVASQKREDSAAIHKSPDRKEIFSHTILQEALKKRDVVYVENIVGHNWADAASVIEARIFSAACFPLCVGDRVFGAVFLITRSPGKSIRRDSLSELTLLATQATLMLACQVELKSIRKENHDLRKLVKEWPSEFVLNRDAEDSKKMQEIEKRIQKVAPSTLSILILGETGTGKEVVAREIHRSSPRAEAVFLAVNCAAIPGPLLESTLFGYEKGAFTGAQQANAGKFVQAHKGTLFLDEIGDLPLELQAKLLRVLQERKVEPLGSAKSIDVDIRILTATHQDLEAAIRGGRFRQDLYYRIAGVTLKLPPLRERRGDILHLAQHFIRKHDRTLRISPSASVLLQNHPWPGNVRELEHVISRAVIFCEGDEIQREDLELDDPKAPIPFSEGGTPFLIPRLEDAQMAFTQEYVEKILKSHSGSRAETAASLGISERTLYRILAADTHDKNA